MVTSFFSGSPAEVVPFGKIEIRSDGSRQKQYSLEERFQVRNVVYVDLVSPLINLVGELVNVLG